MIIFGKVFANDREQEIFALHLLKMMIKDSKCRYEVEILNKSIPNTLIISSTD